MKIEVEVTEQDISDALQRKVRQAIAERGVVRQKDIASLVYPALRSVVERAVEKVWTEKFQAHVEDMVEKYAVEVMKEVLSKKMKTKEV